MKVTIQGQQKAQQAVLKTVRAVRPEGGLGRAVRFLALDAHRHLVSATHVDTGAYRASQFIRQESNSRYRLYIDPTSSNPRTGAKPAVYGPIEESRGGSHAAYDRTYRQGPAMAGRAARFLLIELP